MPHSCAECAAGFTASADDADGTREAALTLADGKYTTRCVLVQREFGDLVYSEKGGELSNITLVNPGYARSGTARIDKAAFTPRGLS